VRKTGFFNNLPTFDTRGTGAQDSYARWVGIGWDEGAILG